MGARRRLAAAALTILLSGGSARAVPNFGAFTTQQCDGTMRSGTITNRDINVQVQQTITDATGLKIGQANAPSLLGGVTGALFRFDDGYVRHLSSGIPGVGSDGVTCPGGLGGTNCIYLTFWDRDHDISANPRGLLGEYYAEKEMITPVRIRTDPKIEFDYGTSSPIVNMPADGFAVRWSGMVKTVDAGVYDFTTYTDDGVRLWVGNSKIIDDWYNQGATSHTGLIGLNADTLYPITMEYFENTGAAVAKLSWKGPSASLYEYIPSSHLYSNPTSAIVGTCVYKKGVNNGNYNLQAAQSMAPPTAGGCPATVSSATAASNIYTTGTPPGTTGGGTAAYGTAYSAFTGSNFYKVPENPQLDLPANYTLSAWIKSTGGAGTYRRVFSQQDGGGHWGFGLDNTGRPRLHDSRVTFPAGIGEDWRTGDASRAPNSTCGNAGDGAWHYIAVTHDSGNKIKKAYLDGKLCASTPTISVTAFSSNTILQPAIIGAYSGDGGASSSERFTGSIDEIRLAYEAVSPEQIFTEYTATLHDHWSPPGSNGTRNFYGIDGADYPTSGLGLRSAVIGTAANGAPSVDYRPPVLANLIPSSHTITFYAASLDGEAVSLQRTVVLNNPVPDPPSISVTGEDVDTLYWRFTPGLQYCKGEASLGAGYNAYYRLYDFPSMVQVQSVQLPTAMAAPETRQIVENVGGVPNTLYTRVAKLEDHWGLSGPTSVVSAYTRAAPPRLLSVTDVSTGSFVLNWDGNGNPAYTRYLIDYTFDNNFNSPSTLVILSDNHTTTNKPLSGLAPSTTFYLRVRAYNGRASDASGVAASTPAFVTAVTLSSGPVLSGTVLGTTGIRWNWNQTPGSIGYRLYDAVTNAVIAQTPNVVAVPPGMRYDQTGLSTNTAHAAYVKAYNPNGEGLSSNVVSLYTAAASIPNAFFKSASSTTVTLEWSPSENPGYTLYEVQVASDSAYSIVIATRVFVSTQGAVSGLFPGTTYFMRVRGLSGSQQYTAYRDALSTATLPDPLVSQAVAPGSPYVVSTDLLGLWHFDEGSGSTSADATGRGYSAGLYCRGSAVQCLAGSTPTWSGGAPALGAGLLLSGLNGGLAEIPSAPLAATGNLTVSLWAKPSTLSLPESAGLAVKGPMNGESFALDVTTGPAGLMYYRFKAKPGQPVVVATAPLRNGQWDHVVGTFDSVTGTTRLFVNGSNQATGAVPAGARTANGSVTTVGCRQSGSTLYDRCFAGTVDDLRVYNRALSPGEVATLYQSHSTNTFTPTTPAGVSIILPPNSFPGSANIYATGDPLGHPIQVQPGLLALGLLNAPTGQALVPGSLIEIVPTIAGQPYAGSLGSTATLIFPFSDSDGDGIIDGTRPPIPASTVRVYTLDTTILRWEALPTTLDQSNRRIIAQTPHFSIFAQFGASTVGTSASTARAYPVPWEPDGPGQFGAQLLTFDTLPPSGRIAIYTLSGEKVIDIPFQSSDAGRKTWDGRNAAGRKVASGLYLAHVKAADGGTAVVKVVIER